MQQNEEKELSPEEIVAQEYLAGATQKMKDIDHLINSLPKGFVPDHKFPGAPTDLGGKNSAYIEKLKHEKEVIKSKVGDDIQKIIEKTPKDVQLSVLKEYLLWEDPRAFDKDRIDFAQGKDAFEITEKKFIKKIIIQREAEKNNLEPEVSVAEPTEKSSFDSLFQSSLRYTLDDYNIEPMDPDPGGGIEDPSIDKDEPDLDKE
jgi:hypothetical protein